MPKILVVLPVATDLFNESHRRLLKKYASKGFDVEVANIKYGTHSVECYFDENLNAPYIVEEVRKAEEKGYNAVIIDCFFDPSVEAAREIAEIPVVGCKEAALHIACMLGPKFSIIGPGGPPFAKLLNSSIREMGLTSRLASIRTIGLMVLDIEEDRKMTVDRLVEEGKRAIDEDGADVLVLGCTGLSDAAEEYKLQERVGIPVVDPLLAALKIAESLVSLNLSHSKSAYPQPPKKPITFPKYA